MTQDNDAPTPTPEFDEFRQEVARLRRPEVSMILPSGPAHVPTPEGGDVVTNEQGGKQSRVDHSFVDLEPEMLLRVTAVLHKERAKYGAKNWRNIPYEDHVNHIGYYWTLLLEGDTTEDHLANIICRAMFAMYMQGKE